MNREELAAREEVVAELQRWKSVVRSWSAICQMEVRHSSCHSHLMNAATRRRVNTRSAIANWVVGFTSILLCGCSYTVLFSWRRDLACHLQQESQPESLFLTTVNDFFSQYIAGQLLSKKNEHDLWCEPPPQDASAFVE